MIKICSQPKSPGALEPSPELLALQNLMPISKEDRANLEKDIIKSKEVRDPIKVYFDKKSGKYLILCGLNRYEIARDNNIDIVPVDIYEGTKKQYRELVINDNLNRRQLTTKQKQKIIDYFLEKDPAQSDRAISIKTGTHHSTVSTRRKIKETGGGISHVDEVKGQDGKTYKKPAKPKRTPKNGRPSPVMDINNTVDDDKKKTAVKAWGNLDPMTDTPALVLDTDIIEMIQGYISAADDREAVKKLIINFVKTC